MPCFQRLRYNRTKPEAMLNRLRKYDIWKTFLFGLFRSILTELMKDVQDRVYLLLLSCRLSVENGKRISTYNFLKKRLLVQNDVTSTWVVYPCEGLEWVFLQIVDKGLSRSIITRKIY